MFSRRSNKRQVSEPGLADQFGSRFVVDEMEDLELLTDLLDLSGNHLNLLFAVASYVQRVPDGTNRLTPVVIERLGRISAQLALTTSANPKLHQGSVVPVIPLLGHVPA